MDKPTVKSQNYSFGTDLLWLQFKFISGCLLDTCINDWLLEKTLNKRSLKKARHNLMGLLSMEMSPLKRLISSNEDWLVKRLFHYAFEQNYAEGTAAVEKAWRNCVAGLSGAIIEGLDTIYPNLGFGPDHNFTNDPLCSFIVNTAKRHRERGVSLQMFQGLMTYYREAWLDLVRNAQWEREYENECLSIIIRMFDRFMIAFGAEWVVTEESRLIEELQLRNRETIIEKNRFLTIFESVPNPVFSIDNQKKIINFNNEAAMLLNASEVHSTQYYHQKTATVLGSIVGESFTTFFPWLADDLEKFIAGHTSSVNLEKEVTGQNETRYYNVKLSRRFDVSKTFVGGVIILEDITGKKQAEEELRGAREAQKEDIKRNETRLTSILNILQHNSSSVTEFLDYALEEAIKLTESKLGFILHYNENKQQFLINTWSKGALHECSIQRRPNKFYLNETGIWGEAVRQRNPIIINDYPAPHPLKKGYPKGHAHIERFMEIPVLIDHQIVAVVAVANKSSDYDQTDVLQLSLLADAVWKAVNAKQMEEALIKSEEKYRTVFETTGSATIIMEENTVITLANQEFCTLFGYSRAEIENRIKFAKFIQKSDLDKLMEYYRLRRIEADADPGNCECQAVDRQGRIIDLLISIALIQGSDKSVVSMVDISDRKRTEMALYTAHQELINMNQQLQESNAILEDQKSELAVARDKAEAANTAKSAFLANMSHELRTPLNSILGYSQLIMRDETLTDIQLGYLNTINCSGEYLLALINDVLEISKIEARHFTLDQTNFDLKALIYELEKMFRIRTNAKGVKLNLIGVDDLPRYVIADEKKLRQILINLLENAEKFTDQGRISLRTAAEYTSLDHIRLVMEVEDTGMGIAEEEYTKLFQHFEQTASGRQSQRGTGLGLAISKEYAQLMGGDITVASKVGKGSTFRMEIAVKPGSATGMSKGGSSHRVIALEPGTDIPRVLIVEDQTENRELLQTLLVKTGFEVREAFNGIEAVNVFEQWRPHFIWMDIRLPLMNGLEATRCIKASQKGYLTKIVALSASVLEEDKEMIMAAGCDGFVGKPYREEEIFEVMAGHLGLKYLYQENTSQEYQDQWCDDTDFKHLAASLDVDLRNQLYEAVIELETCQTMQVIERISDLNPHVGRILKNLAANLDYDSLLKLCENKN